MSYKGQTKITLTDIKTGEKEEYIENNTFTDSVHDLVNLPFFNPYATYKTLSGDVRTKACDDNSTDSSYFYNGIALFGDTISTSKYYADGKTQIGYAVKGVADSGPYSGSYDSSKSSKNVRAYTFTSGQCNGTIRSICLMNPDGARITYGINGIDDEFPTTVSFSNRCEVNVPFPKKIYARPRNGVWVMDKSRYYEFYVGDLSNNKYAFYCDIYEYHADKIDILNGAYEKLETKTLLGSTTYGYGDRRPIVSASYDEATGKIYYIVNCNSADYQNHKDIYAFVCTINNDGGLTVTQKNLNSTCPNSTYNPTTAPDGSQYKVDFFPHVYNGKVLFTLSNFQDYEQTDELYMLNLNNLSDKARINNPMVIPDSTSQYPLYKMGSMVYFGNVESTLFNNVKTCVADLSTGTMKKVNIKNGAFSDTTGEIDPFAGYTPAVWCVNNGKHIGYIPQDGKYIYLNPMALTTINNLETPIVKTSDKTMEIVYTLTPE